MTKSGGRHDPSPRSQITQEERRPRIIRSSALPLGDRAARERLSVHRLRKSIKAAPLYARLRTVRTVIIAAAAARADRSRIEAVLARTKKLLRQGCAT